MPWTNVRTAIELLQVDRLDHGCTIVYAPDYARQCAERGIVFTVVPTDSCYLRTLASERWALDHPIRRMPGLGLRIHTDDPTLHKVTPTGARCAACRACQPSAGPGVWPPNLRSSDGRYGSQGVGYLVDQAVLWRSRRAIYPVGVGCLHSQGGHGGIKASSRGAKKKTTGLAGWRS